MTQDELKLVFNALKQCNIFAYAGGLGVRATAHTDALAILEKALAQEQEPWCMKMNGCKTKCEDCPVEVAQPEQEPVADDFFRMIADKNPKPFPLPQRTWVGLTGEEAMDVTRKEGHELLDFIYEYGTGSEGVEERIVAICKAIEARLKDKNT